MADKNKIRKKSGISNNNRYYAGSGGVISRNAGYNRGAERYRERLRRDSGRVPQTFPNTRRKIITGKDLTTPLVRSKIIHKRVAVNIKTVSVAKERLPWFLIGKLLAGVLALFCLIWSQIVLFDSDYKINMTFEKIKAEQIETNSLERQFELQNDPAEILRIAREEYGMVDEMFIQKNYIKSQRENKAVVIEKNNSFFSELFDFFTKNN